MLDLSGLVMDSVVDGPGLRATIFCQGCPHHCEGCHNPETWEFGCGTATSVDELLRIIRSNPLCNKVTFSGGEPFAQAESFARLARQLKAIGYEVASYTGYTFEALLNGSDAQKALLAQLDVLIDGPFILEQRSLEVPFRGSRNQRILDVPKSLEAGEAVCITTGRWAGEY